MKWNLFSYQLKFRYPFKIAHTLRCETDALFFRLSANQGTHWGEAVFPPYIGQNRDEFIDFFSKLKVPDNFETAPELHDYLKRLKVQYPDFKAGIAGFDIALHQYLAAKQGVSLSKLMGLTDASKESSLTIGICTKSEMKDRVEQSENKGYFKLKVDQDCAFEMVENFRSVSDRAFVIDANQGFTNREQALSFARYLKALGVAYLEQPFNKTDLVSHRWLKAQKVLPIIADESFQGLRDVARLIGSFDGINVKLSKCGGLVEASQSLQEAKSLSMKTVLGCMSESSVAINAAKSLTVLADFIDLDGPQLIVNDPDLSQFG